MMQRIYAVPTVEALAVYEPEMRLGIQRILSDARDRGNNNRTLDDVWEEIVEHVAGAPYSRLWFTLDDGVLVSWITGKTYVDGRKRNGCITWAWAAPGCRTSRDMIDLAEAFFRERECQTAYLGRGFMQPGFTRLMRRYGYVMATVVYEKPLDREEADNGRTVRPPGGEIRADAAVGDGEPIPEAGTDAAGIADDGPSEPSLPRSDGEPAQHGDIGADAASDVLPAGDGAVDAGSVGTAGGEAVGSGDDGSDDAEWWQWGLFGCVVAPGGESAGTPDPGPAGTPGPE